jgi:hypothetical protein
MRFIKSELAGASLRISFCATMKTCKIASPRGLPDNRERPLIEIHKDRHEQDACQTN